MSAPYIVRPATVDDIPYLAAFRRAMFASMGVVIQRMPPSPRNMDGRQAYIMNIYTLPEWRHHGMATAIMQAILDYLHGLGVPVATLHATDAGRPIYQRFGFAPTNEMRLMLNGGGPDCALSACLSTPAL